MNQCALPQVLHAPPLQPPQPPPDVPLTGWPPLEAEKRDMARRVFLLWQCSHAAGLSAWLIGRMTSNLVWQSEQTYSKIGMVVAVTAYDSKTKALSAVRSPLPQGRKRRAESRKRSA